MARGKRARSLFGWAAAAEPRWEADRELDLGDWEQVVADFRWSATARGHWLAAHSWPALLRQLLGRLGAAGTPLALQHGMLDFLEENCEELLGEEEAAVGEELFARTCQVLSSIVQAADHSHPGTLALKGHVLTTLVSLMVSCRAIFEDQSLLESWVDLLLSLVERVGSLADSQLRATACDCLRELETCYPGVLYGKFGHLAQLAHLERTHAKQAYLLLVARVFSNAAALALTAEEPLALAAAGADPPPPPAPGRRPSGGSPTPFGARSPPPSGAADAPGAASPFAVPEGVAPAPGGRGRQHAWKVRLALLSRRGEYEDLLRALLAGLYLCTPPGALALLLDLVPVLQLLGPGAAAAARARLAQTAPLYDGLYGAAALHVAAAVRSSWGAAEARALVQKLLSLCVTGSTACPGERLVLLHLLGAAVQERPELSPEVLRSWQHLVPSPLASAEGNVLQTLLLASALESFQATDATGEGVARHLGVPLQVMLKTLMAALEALLEYPDPAGVRQTIVAAFASLLRVPALQASVTEYVVQFTAARPAFCAEVGRLVDSLMLDARQRGPGLALLRQLGHSVAAMARQQLALKYRAGAAPAEAAGRHVLRYTPIVESVLEYRGTDARALLAALAAVLLNQPVLDAPSLRCWQRIVQAGVRRMLVEHRAGRSRPAQTLRRILLHLCRAVLQVAGAEAAAVVDRLAAALQNSRLERFPLNVLQRDPGGPGGAATTPVRWAGADAGAGAPPPPRIPASPERPRARSLFAEFEEASANAPEERGPFGGGDRAAPAPPAEAAARGAGAGWLQVARAGFANSDSEVVLAVDPVVRGLLANGLQVLRQAGAVPGQLQWEILSHYCDDVQSGGPGQGARSHITVPCTVRIEAPPAGLERIFGVQVDFLAAAEDGGAAVARLPLLPHLAAEPAAQGRRELGLRYECRSPLPVQLTPVVS